jgi:hypothetical protein
MRSVSSAACYDPQEQSRRMFPVAFRAQEKQGRKPCGDMVCEVLDRTQVAG